MDPRLYSVVDGPGVYRAGGQPVSDGVDLAAAFYADATALPSCHQLRSPRTGSVVDSLEPAQNPVSRDFVARAFYDGGGGRAATTGAASFWDRRRSSFLPDSMAPGVIGGYDGVAGPATADSRSCRSDSIGGKDTAAAAAASCSASSISSASITSSMTSSSSASPRKKKPIGTI